MINDINNIKEKLDFFKSRGEPIHFKLIDSEFRNGYVLDIKDNSFILDELVFGETLIHFNEIIPSSIVKSISKKLNNKLM